MKSIKKIFSVLKNEGIKGIIKQAECILNVAANKFEEV